MVTNHAPSLLWFLDNFVCRKIIILALIPPNPRIIFFPIYVFVENCSLIAKWGENWARRWYIISSPFEEKEKSRKLARNRTGNERLFRPRFRVGNFKDTNCQRPPCKCIYSYFFPARYVLAYRRRTPTYLLQNLYAFRRSEASLFYRPSKTVGYIKVRLKSIYQGENLPTWRRHRSYVM